MSKLQDFKNRAVRHGEIMLVMHNENLVSNPFINKLSSDSELERRLFKRIVITASGCWEWQSTKTPDGYGKIVVAWKKRQPVRRFAHRIAYQLKVGAIPEGYDIDHLCRNRSCVNPAHLEPVTRKENVKRGNVPALMKAKAQNQTHCKRGHLLAGDNLVSERKEKGLRLCKICRTNWKRENYRKNRDKINQKRRNKNK